MAPCFVVNAWTSVLMESVVIPALISDSTSSRVARTRRPALLMPSTSRSPLNRTLNLRAYTFLRSSSLFTLPTCKQHFLYFRPLPQGHGSFLPVLFATNSSYLFLVVRCGLCELNPFFWKTEGRARGGHGLNLSRWPGLHGGQSKRVTVTI